MKKALKIYGWAWGIVVMSTLLAIVLMWALPSHHDLAKDPHSIERIVKVDLPDIAHVESEDNMERGSSRWDAYTHCAQFSEKLSERSIAKLEELCQKDSKHWSKDEDKGCYSFQKSGGIDELYYVSCAIYDEYFLLSYEVSEDEGLFVIFSFFLAYHILLIWGVVLILIWGIIKIFSHKRV